MIVDEEDQMEYSQNAEDRCKDQHDRLLVEIRFFFDRYFCIIETGAKSLFFIATIKNNF